jgi:squalene cyclase
MYQPNSVMLQQARSGKWWLTDMYVMLNVTGDPGVAGLEPGEYRIMGSGEMRELSTRVMDVDGYLYNIAGQCRWREAEPTEWSVAEHPGKAMLFSVRQTGTGKIQRYALLGEGTWTALTKYHPVKALYYSQRNNLFLFDMDTHSAYVAGIRCPEGQEKVAEAIALAHASTSKYDGLN